MGNQIICLSRSIFQGKIDSLAVLELFSVYKMTQNGKAYHKMTKSFKMNLAVSCVNHSKNYLFNVFWSKNVGIKNVQNFIFCLIFLPPLFIFWLHPLAWGHTQPRTPLNPTPTTYGNTLHKK